MLEHQVAIARHYGNMRKFSALGDDRGAIRTACLQDFAIPADTPEHRSQIASIVAAWETSKEYMAKEVELKFFKSTNVRQCFELSKQSMEP